MKRILVLGGGAAGLAAAISAAGALGGRGEVTLLERSPRVAKKLLATGNGRCNFGNSSVSAEKYFSRDGGRVAALLQTIDECPPERWLAGLGLLSREEEDGRLYPYSNQAADLLNLLLYWLERCGVKVLTGREVAAVGGSAGGFWVECSGGERLHGQAVICALGGSAAPQFGADGSGFELARRCGCKMEPLYPCLVPLKCDKRQIQGLSGIRVRAGVSLLSGGAPVRAERGEVQFTDYGLSGIAVMQLSGLLSPDGGLRSPQLSIDLFPQMEKQRLALLLEQRAALFSEGTLFDMAAGLLNKRAAQAVFGRLGLGGGRAAGSLSRRELDALAEAFKDWRFDRLEPLGWRHAQTTGGGISLCQLEDSFSLKGREGLYFVGETLDCAGLCGGFNLHWAFGSGAAAGRHAAKSLLDGSKKTG